MVTDFIQRILAIGVIGLGFAPVADAHLVQGWVVRAHLPTVAPPEHPLLDFDDVAAIGKGVPLLQARGLQRALSEEDRVLLGWVVADGTGHCGDGVDGSCGVRATGQNGHCDDGDSACHENSLVAEVGIVPACR